MTREEIDKIINVECKESRLFKAVIDLAKLLEVDDRNSLLNPDLTDSGAHFNRGRMAASNYMVEVLEEYIN